MFLLFGYISIALVQWYRQYRRRYLYSSVMYRALQKSSVLVQKGKCSYLGNVASTFFNSVLLRSLPASKQILFSDNFLSLSMLHPKQQIDLGEWTSYLDMHPGQDLSNSVITLIEAGRPEDRNSFLQRMLKDTTTGQLHVLQYGCPIAWKPGNPFGIILHCTYRNFVLMCDAFGQECLTLAKDLELYHILSVSVVGQPRSLKRISQTSSPSHTIRSKQTENSITRSVCQAALSVREQEHTEGLLSAAQLHSHNTNKVSGQVPSPSRTMADIKKKSVHDETKHDIGTQQVLTINCYDGATSLIREQVYTTVKHSQQLLEPVEESSEKLFTSLTRTVPGFVTETYAKQSDENVISPNVHLVMGTNNFFACSTETENSELLALTEEQSLNIKTALSSDTETNQLVNIPIAANLCTDGFSEKNSDSLENSSSSALTCILSNDAELWKDKSESENVVNLTNSVNEYAHSLANNNSNVNGISSLGQDLLEKNVSSSLKQKCRQGKPPNILVYCGKKDSVRKFEAIRSKLSQCLNTDAYTVYHLLHDQVFTAPWEDNSAALIISCDNLYGEIDEKFCKYLLAGGKVISFGSSMEAKFVEHKKVQDGHSISHFNFGEWRDVSAIRGQYRYVLRETDKCLSELIVDCITGEPLVILFHPSSSRETGHAVFSQLFLERDPAEIAADSTTFSQLKQSNNNRLHVMRHFVSMLGLDTSPPLTLQLTPCFLLTQDQSLKTILLQSISSRLKQGIIKSSTLSLQFVDNPSAVFLVTSSVLPVIIEHSYSSTDGFSAENFKYFQVEAYWHYLTSSVLGRIVFYTDVIPTTMPVFEGRQHLSLSLGGYVSTVNVFSLPQHKRQIFTPTQYFHRLQFSLPEGIGVIAIAGRQTGGKGRGGNIWLSPAGCAMFTLPLYIPVNSPLGHSITFVQHIVGLAIVLGIRSLPGYQDLELQLKWPNDIYYKDAMKLGGILVSSTIMNHNVYFTIGCGINVSNSDPTICINDIIKQHNQEKGTNLSELMPAQVIARGVSTLEDLISRFQKNGHEDFCQLYYKYWLHSGAIVRLEQAENEEVKICGLDEFGFLRVLTRAGKAISVQPDGNSFDMMHNLIAIKK